MVWRRRQRVGGGQEGHVRVRLTVDPQPIRDQGWIEPEHLHLPGARGEAGQGQAERSEGRRGG